MLNRIEKLQGGLVRAESYVLLVCVLAMLLLAAYNVFYRNVLVPLQIDLREAQRASASAAAPGDGEAEPTESESASGDEPEEAEESDKSKSDDFGGGFGSGSEDAEEASAEASDESEDEGFKGGFGGQAEGGAAEEDAEDEESEEPSEDESAESNFKGGFGAEEGETKEAEQTEEDESGEENSGGFGGGFGEGGGSDEGEQEAGKTAAVSEQPAAPRAPESAERPPADRPSSSWTSFGIRAIDTLKLSWVDTFLRHMVLVVGFLGGMIAVRRREHITIDAVGRLLEGRAYHVARAATNLFATAACAALAWAGWDLVAMSLEFPEELMPGVQLWAVQTIFPIGFGMIGVHFLLRTADSGVRAYLDVPIEEEEPEVDVDLDLDERDDGEEEAP